MEVVDQALKRQQALRRRALRRQAIARPAIIRPTPFGIGGGLYFLNICLLCVFPPFFALCYAQVTFFYFFGKEAAPGAAVHGFYQLCHFAVLAELPLSLFAGVVLCLGMKIARKACNIFFAASALLNLLALLSIPPGIERVAPDWIARPSHIAFAASAAAALAGMLYVNLSARCNNTYDRFNNIPVRRAPPHTLLTAAILGWSFSLMGIWLVAALSFLDRYLGV